jgi:hypothetical protein
MHRLGEKYQESLPGQKRTWIGKSVIRDDAGRGDPVPRRYAVYRFACGNNMYYHEKTPPSVHSMHPSVAMVYKFNH